MEKERFLELQSFWDAKVDREADREKVDPRKQVHTDLLWREINRCIDGRKGLKIMDAGAGTGRFSIPLTQAGHKVVHLDISPEMIDATRRIAVSLGITGIEFVHASIDDLSLFADNTFDVVLCCDGPLSSYCDNYEGAVGELVRVSKQWLLVCVMNRAGVISEGGINFDLEHFGKLKTVRDVSSTGNLDVNQELRQIRPTLFPSWHSFRPDELRELLERHGCRVERMSAPGTLARFVDPDLLRKLFTAKEAYEDYLDFEEEYDSDTYVLGVGASGASGLLAVGLIT